MARISSLRLRLFYGVRPALLFVSVDTDILRSSLVILCAASSQLGFFYETGNEIEWDDAVGFAHDAEGMKVLLSGAGAVVVSGILILVIAAFARAFLYRAVGTFLVGIGAPLVFGMLYLGVPASPCRDDAMLTVFLSLEIDLAKWACQRPSEAPQSRPSSRNELRLGRLLDGFRVRL